MGPTVPTLTNMWSVLLKKKKKKKTAGNRVSGSHKLTEKIVTILIYTLHKNYNKNSCVHINMTLLFIAKM